MFNVYKNQQSRQTGSRNLMGSKTLPTIWGTYMKLVTKYQISAINSCWEKCAYMFNVYKNQQSRQTGSRNLTGPKTLPTIWYTYMKLVTKYQISAINSYWEKCDEKYLGRTDRGKTVNPPPPSGSGGIIIGCRKNILSIFVALLTFYNKEKKKKISHFKMPTLNSDVTVNSYNNFYLFQWNICTEMTVFWNL
jgi:hypothetical protein